MKYKLSGLNGKKIFLIDSIGAIFSAFFLGFVLVHLQTFFGMPVKALYFLATIAIVFSIYSFLNYVFFSKHWRLLLKIIALSNLAYIALTLTLVIYFREQLTWLGWTYFILEIGIICVLVWMEFRIIRNTSSTEVNQ